MVTKGGNERREQGRLAERVGKKKKINVSDNEGLKPEEVKREGKKGREQKIT